MYKSKTAQQKAHTAHYSRVLQYFASDDNLAKTIWYEPLQLKEKIVPQIPSSALSTSPVVDVVVENDDVIECARRLIQQGHNPLVLNLASNFKPGGGVDRGRIAQEESLFLRSNYYTFLDSRQYPLDGKMAYSPGVQFLWNMDHEKLHSNDQVLVSCLAAAALKDPPTNGPESYKKSSDAEFMQTMCDNIFKVAILHGHDSLVLGALGCGVYHNPPIAVAGYFANAIRKWGSKFQHITFAIKEDRSNEYLGRIFRQTLNVS